MTGTALAINASAGSPAYAARTFRDALAGLMGWDGVPLAGRQGVRPMGGTAVNIVTLSGSTITVNLHAATVTPGWSAVTGTYLCALTAIETWTLTAADATNPRKDIVIGRVYDDDESASGLRQYVSAYIAGTPGPAPAEPAVPVGGIKLATIDVPQTGGGSPAVTQNAMYTSAVGGILVVRTQAERDAIVNPHEGQWVYRVDRGWPEYYASGAWHNHRLVTAMGGTSEISAPVLGQTSWHITNKSFWTYDGTTWIRQGLAATQIASAFVTTSSTTYGALTGDPGIAFTAPVSGQIWVNISAALLAGDTATVSRMSFQARTGSTIGSGTIIYAVTDNDSIAMKSTNDAEFSREALVTGLTPGASYNVQCLYLKAGTSTGGFARRKINIKDAN